MSDDGRGAWDGGTVSVLDDDAALGLLRESVTGAALEIGLIGRAEPDSA